MTDHDADIAALLERATPPSAPPQDGWDAVVREATSAPRRRLAAGVPAALALAAAALVLALAWPFGGSHGGGTVLERALAAVGDGPVLHVVFREGWHGTLVNLESGARSELHGQKEAWYDPARGVHEVSTFDGVVQSDVVYSADRLPPIVKQTYAGLLDGYRGALRSGNVSGDPGEVDGEPVYWIKVHRELLPDVADAKLHEFAEELAVSRETYQPVALRDARDDVPGPDGASRIVKLESLPAGEGDFTAHGGGIANGTAVRSESRQIDAVEAASVMDRPALWLGRTFAGLDLARLERTSTIVGRVQMKQVTPVGVASECRKHATNALDPGAAIAACVRRGQALGARSGGPPAFTPAGPSEWGPPHVGVRVSYGAALYSQGGPAPDSPYVLLEETTALYPEFGRGATGYMPPEGTVVLFGGRIGLLRSHGVDVHIEASSEDLLLAAARALEPIPVS